MVHIPSEKSKEIDAAIERFENPNPDNARPWGGKIITPNTRQLATFASPIHRTCADCKYFSHKNGQRLLYDEKGLAAVVYDYGWKERYLGADPKDLGECGRRGALTAPFYSACEEFKSK